MDLGKLTFPGHGRHISQPGGLKSSLNQPWSLEETFHTAVSQGIMKHVAFRSSCRNTS